MAAFQFDEAKNFDANLAAYLDHMDTVDAELGAVLRTHAGLISGVGESGRKAARTAFNTAVVASLEKLLTSATGGEK